MSNQPTFKEMNNATVELTPREYYQYRTLALQNKIMFTVEWTKGKAEVTCEAMFLLAFGYIDKIQF